MDAHEADLRTALLNYVTTVYDAVENTGEMVPPISSRSSGWVHVEGNRYRYNPMTTQLASGYSEILSHHRDGPEHQQCVDALYSHPTIKDRVDKLVGTTLGLMQLQAELVPGMVLARMESLEDFDEAFGEVYRWLIRETTTYCLVAALPTLDLKNGPIDLDSGVEIDLMTKREMVACLMHGVIASSPAFDMVEMAPQAALRVRQTLTVVVDGERPERAELDLLWNDWRSAIEDALTALRLYKSGPMRSSGAVYLPLGPPPITHSFEIPTPRPAERRTYTLTSDDASALRAFWHAVRSRAISEPATPQRRALLIALRRFGFADERSRPVDRLIDLMIAAEALFLPAERGSGAFKVAVRAAAFLSGLGDPSRDVFQHFKVAYKARNAIAHGDEVPNLKFPDGADATLDDYATLVADYLRRVLERMVVAADRDEPLPMDDWDAFVLERFGGLEASAVITRD